MLKKEMMEQTGLSQTEIERCEQIGIIANYSSSENEDKTVKVLLKVRLLLDFGFTMKDLEYLQDNPSLISQVIQRRKDSFRILDPQKANQMEQLGLSVGSFLFSWEDLVKPVEEITRFPGMEKITVAREPFVKPHSQLEYYRKQVEQQKNPYETEQKSRREKGKFAIRLILGIYLLLGILSVVLAFSYEEGNGRTAIVPFIIRVGFAYFIYKGVKWCRYLLAASSLIVGVFDIIMITSLSEQAKMLLEIQSMNYFYPLVFIEIVLNIGIGIFLFAYKPIKEYLDS